MSNAEHLIENAIMTFENYQSFDTFHNNNINKAMAEMVGISLDDVEAMAIHVIYAFKPNWEEAERDRLVKLYGYGPIEEE